MTSHNVASVRQIKSINMSSVGERKVSYKTLADDFESQAHVNESSSSTASTIVAPDKVKEKKGQLIDCDDNFDIGTVHTVLFEGYEKKWTRHHDAR